MRIHAYASGSGGNLYRVSADGSSLLIEAGLPMKQIRKALDFDLTNLEACLISHAHQDHARAVTDLLNAGVNVWMHDDAARSLWRVPSKHSRLFCVSNYGPRNIAMMQLIGPWLVRFFTLEHDAAGTCGFQILHGHNSLLYITDTRFVRYKFPPPTHIMIECNYARDILDENVRAGIISHDLRNRIRRSHMSLGTVKDMLRANDLSRLQEVWLLHLSDANSDKERFKREVQEITGRPVFVAPRGPR